jgi:hypothetical protein
MSGRAALSPETIKRRKRRRLPSTPEESLGEKIGQLPEANEELKNLFKSLLEEAKKETMFTMTLERDRLFSALYYAGFAAPLWVNTEVQLAPLATTTVFAAVPPGFVLAPRGVTAYTSLPWWLTSTMWLDSDPPALPSMLFLRGPETYRFNFEGIIPVKRYFRLTLTNTHLVNTINFISMLETGLVTESVWKMLETIYVKPIAEYVQQISEERTGRPFP